MDKHNSRREQREDVCPRSFPPGLSFTAPPSLSFSPPPAVGTRTATAAVVIVIAAAAVTFVGRIHDEGRQRTPIIGSIWLFANAANHSRRDSASASSRSIQARLIIKTLLNSTRHSPQPPFLVPSLPSDLLLSACPLQHTIWPRRHVDGRLPRCPAASSPRLTLFSSTSRTSRSATPKTQRTGASAATTR